MVFPDSSDSEVQIAFKAPELPTTPDGKKVKCLAPKGFKAELYDGRGKKVHSKTTETDEMRLDTSGLPDGLYHLTVTRGKAVIQRNLSVKH